MSQLLYFYQKKNNTTNNKIKPTIQLCFQFFNLNKISKIKLFFAGVLILFFESPKIVKLVFFWFYLINPHPNLRGKNRPSAIKMGCDFSRLRSTTNQAVIQGLSGNSCQQRSSGCSACVPVCSLRFFLCCCSSFFMLPSLVCEHYLVAIL